jgi:molybdenum cofactor guanylyltransferase
MHPVSAIILAGGQSKRMGRDKALLPFPGNTQITFLARLTALLRPLCREVVIVARDTTQAAAYTLPGITVMIDKQPGVGPLMGIYSGLSAIHYSHAFVTAVDTPFLQPALLSYLLAQPLTDALLIPRVQDAPQVLLAIYPRSMLPLIETYLQQGHRGPRSLLAIAPVQYIEEPQLRAIDPQLRSFMNINTPADLDLH